MVTLLRKISPPLGFGKLCPHRVACKVSKGQGFDQGQGQGQEKGLAKKIFLSLDKLLPKSSLQGKTGTVRGTRIETGTRKGTDKTN